MSRLSKKPIVIPQGVSVEIGGDAVLVKGSKGEQRVPRLAHVEVAQGEGGIQVSTNQSMKQARANLGTQTSLIKGAVQGVSAGYDVTLEIEGVGYRAQMEGNTIVLFLGFVNPVRFTPPEGITIVVEKNTTIKVSGSNKQFVTQAAAKIRSFKKPEPYKGKGIRYQGEVVRRKVGKKAAASK